ncbi:protease modulator HflC [Buchnera aphidicola (Formosaphis micheliae)]|uniref:protease modulator HflC n=1 Tax=Buchnera aphidicola TaxID=9 RepID=UPI0031B865A6
MHKICFVFIICLLISLFSCCFIISEGERGILIRHGKIIRNKNNNIIVYNPGLHYKLPIVDYIKKIDTKLNITQNRSRCLLIKENKNCTFNYYIQWKICNLNSDYLVNNNFNFYKIETLLKNRVDNMLCAEINKLIIPDENKNDMVHRLNNAMYKLFVLHKSEFKNYNIKDSNSNSSQNINIDDVSNLGIKIVDICLKNIHLSTIDVNSIINTMNSENQDISRSLRLKGQIEASKIKLKANYEVTKLLAEAKNKELLIKSDQKIIIDKILNNIFIKEPMFFHFIKMVSIYDSIYNIDNHDKILAN